MTNLQPLHSENGNHAIETRKSERERKNIRYDKFAVGLPDSDDEFKDISANPTMVKQESNKQKKLEQKAGAKNAPSENQKKCQDLFDTLKADPNSDIFNRPLDVNHPLYEELKNDYQTLSMIELHFKIGNKYHNTDKIG